MRNSLRLLPLSRIQLHPEAQCPCWDELCGANGDAYRFETGGLSSKTSITQNLFQYHDTIPENNGFVKSGA